jgi:hypothetical protein
MINLTQPAFALLKGEIPQDNRTWLIYGKLVENLQKCKIAFADVDLFAIFGNKLTTFFELVRSNVALFDSILSFRNGNIEMNNLV